MRQIILSLFLLALISCKGQNNDKTNITGSNNNNQTDPRTEVKVIKEYDKDGNLIRYDSTYFYSNIENDSTLKDSILNNFKTFFNQTYHFSNEAFFDDFLFQDSLLQYDFYNNDFFLERFKNNHIQMNDLFKQMDSLKKYIFNQQFNQPNKKKITH